MADTVIENPILSSPFREPDRHWQFTDEGITNEIVETRRASDYFMPIPPPKNEKALRFDTEWSQGRIERATRSTAAGNGSSRGVKTRSQCFLTAVREPRIGCNTGFSP